MSMYKGKNNIENRKLSDYLIPIKKVPVSDTSKYKKIRVKLNLEGVEAFDSSRDYSDTRPFYVRKKGELIIGKQNFFNGSIAIIPDKLDGSICSNAIMSFDVVKIDKRYFYYNISRKKYLNLNSSKANGTGQKELSERDFLNFDIVVHNKIETQNQIGSFFSAIDELLEKYIKETNSTYNVGRYTISKIFKNEKGFTNSKETKSREWKKVRLADISTLITKGSTPSYYTENGVKFFKVESIENESINLKKVNYIDSKTHSSVLFRSQLQENDILFSIAGTLGRKVIVENSMLPANTNQALAIIRIDENKADFNYINSNLHEEKIKNFIKENVTTGAQPNLSLKQISSLSVELPPIEEQVKISKLDNLFKKLFKFQNERNNLLRKYKKYYLDTIFSTKE